MFVTSVLYSVTHDRIYIGYPYDLIDRFHSPNEFATKGHIAKFHPREVIYVEFFVSLCYRKPGKPTKERSLVENSSPGMIFLNMKLFRRFLKFIQISTPKNSGKVIP